MKPLFLVQQQLADAVRYPRRQTVLDIAPERLAVYRELVLNNVSTFIRSTFPVLRQICGDELFDLKISTFFRQSQLDSPYFIEIPQFFLEWISEHDDGLPSFATELAHYEWLELDLFRRTGTAEFNTDQLLTDPTDTSRIKLSALLEVVAYQYPVHQLSVHYQPTEPPEQPTFLALYRGQDDHVHFMQLTALSAATMQMLMEQQDCTTDEAIAALTSMVPTMEKAQIQQGIFDLLKQLSKLGIAEIYC